jgi:hypothetical protein
MEVRLTHDMKCQKTREPVVGDLIDDPRRQVGGDHDFLPRLLIDRAVIAGKVAGVGQFKVDDLESWRPVMHRNSHPVVFYLNRSGQPEHWGRTRVSGCGLCQPEARNAPLLPELRILAEIATRYQANGQFRDFIVAVRRESPAAQSK